MGAGPITQFAQLVDPALHVQLNSDLVTLNPDNIYHQTMESSSLIVFRVFGLSMGLYKIKTKSRRISKHTF